MDNPTENQPTIHLPRNKAVALFTVIIFLCIVSVVRADTQRIEIPSIRCDRFSLTLPKLRVSLQQVRSDADYVIGIQIDNSLQQNGSIEIGDFVTAANHGHRDFQSLTAVGREKLEIGNNSVTVSGLDDCRGSLFLLLTVPAATKVVLSVNGKTEFAGIPVKGAILHRGQLVATEFLGRHQLFSRLLFPEIDNPQPEAVKTKNDGYSLSQDALNKRLISFNKPANHPEAIGGDLETVTLAIRIDAKGSVVLAKPLAGREPFVSEAVNSISQARFKPFVVNSAPVDSSGDVTFVFSKDGRVSSSLK